MLLQITGCISRTLAVHNRRTKTVIAMSYSTARVSGQGYSAVRKTTHQMLVQGSLASLSSQKAQRGEKYALHLQP